MQNTEQEVKNQPLRGRLLIQEIQRAGYKPVESYKLPEGIVVYQASDVPPVRTRGTTLARCYAVSEDGIVGWPQLHKSRHYRKIELGSFPDPIQMAVRNLLGRQRVISEGHSSDQTAYLLKIQRKMRNSLDSLGSQRRTS